MEARMDKIVAAVAAVLAVPAVLVGYILLVEFVVRRFPRRTGARLRPFLWIMPAVAFLVVFLIWPTLSTIWISFLSRNEKEFVGLANYLNFFSRPDTLTALRNNVLWIVLLTGITVGLGLIVAILVDRVRYESVVKSVIFLPMAISFVAASVIWRLMYDLDPDTGVLNAIVTGLGGEPIAWLVASPLNNVMLILVGAWMLTGFAMVILSAGLKGISTELLEASRVDGANEWQVFRNIILPLLLPTIAVISTTVIIYALKTFDVVFVMTAGNFGTEVIANRMYKELFNFGQPGRASATAVILLIAIIPVMIINIRRFREQEALR
jgi:alpha-glucoside transport system permease protein